MRLLIVYPYVPYPLNRGSYYRYFHLARQLGLRHEVDLFCLDDSNSEEHLPVFQSFCKRVFFQPFQNPPWPRLFPERLLNFTPTTVTHWTDDEAMRALLGFAEGRTYDLVEFCDLVMWQYVEDMAIPLKVMDRSRVDLQFQLAELSNLPLDLKQKLLRRENIWKLRSYEAAVAGRLSSTVVCGPDDETFLRSEVPEAREIKVLANGMDETYFDREQFPPNPDAAPTVLFCGAMDYSPNYHGLAWFFEHCDPLLRQAVPERRILIVGKNPVESVRALESIPGVTVTGGVPDVRPYYQRAWAQMVPLLIGGGTRLKIVESLSIGTPVVSTAIGAQGLDLRHEEHILLADSPEDFAAALARILLDGKLRQALSDAGRAQALNRYTWERLGAELSDYYIQLASQPASQP